MADSFTPLGFVKIEVGQSSGTWGQKTNTNWDAADTKITANTTAITAAAAVAAAALPRTGGTLTGSLTVPSLVLDSAGFLTVSGGAMSVNYDAGDYTAYDRANNNWVVAIGDSAKFVVGANSTAANTPLILNATPTAANHAVPKSYVDNLVSTRFPVTGGAITGDLTVYRPGSPGTGAVFLGNQGHSLYHDGVNNFFSTGEVYAQGSRLWSSANLNPAVYAPLGGALFTGTLRSQAQIVSQGTGNNTVTCYDYNQGFCVGMMAGAGAGLYFVNADSQGNYIGSWRALMSSNGDLTATGNIVAYSDARKKANISTIDDALEIVNNLRGVRYTRTDKEDTSRRHTGVIAQEVQQHLPEVVDEVEGYLTVCHGAMVGVLIEAIKALTRRVADLEDEVI